MEFAQVTFDRLFAVARFTYWPGIRRTHIGFESKGKRYFDVTVPEWPRVEEGMTIVALLKYPNDWGNKSLLGWIDCTDGSIVCDAPSSFFGVFAILMFFLLLFALSVPPTSSSVVDLILAMSFGGGAIVFLYRFCVAYLVKRALILVRNQLNTSAPQ